MSVRLVTALPSRADAVGGHVAGPDGHFDLRVAQFFTEMRRLLGQPRHLVAHRIGTSEMVIAALEGGDLVGIPSGDALVRVVASYTALLGLDPRPILTHIQDARSSWLATSERPQPVPPSIELLAALEDISRAREDAAIFAAVSAPRPQDPRLASDAPPAPDEREYRVRRRRRRRLRRTLAAGVVVAALSVGIWTALERAPLVYSALATLPKQVGQPLRSTYDQVLAALAPRRDGLRWIDSDRPQSRKTDKLPKEAN
jgi:hypothetical protein